MEVISPLKNRIRRLLLSPFVASAAALWLVVDFIPLPPDAGVKRMLETASQERARVHSNRFEEGAIFRRDGAIDLLYEDFVYDPDDPSCVGSVLASGRLYRHGWWATTSTSYNATLRAFYWQPVTPSETQQVRELFAAHFEADGDDFRTEYGRAIRQNLGVVSRPTPKGHFRNSLALLCALLLLLKASHTSLQGLRRSRDSRRIKRGLCPKCAYPVGTNEVCTECGAAVAGRTAEA